MKVGAVKAAAVLASALTLTLMLAACGSWATGVEGAAPAVRGSRAWRGVATADDRKRIRDWRVAWVEGLRQARAAGNGAAITREGALLDPDAAIGGEALPDGSYACRVLKLGRQSAGGPPFVVYPPFECRVRPEGGGRHFAKLTGSQRPVGHLYSDGDAREVFLGTLILGDEQMAMRYGRDRQRDVAGIVQRIGPRRWRMVLPYPRFESVVDVVELVPVG